MRAVTPTRHFFDIKKIRTEVERIIPLCPFFAETNQISLRHRPEVSNQDMVARFRDGVGALKNYNQQGQNVREDSFSVLHAEIANSYLGEIFRFVESRFPRARGRYRIRRLKPRVCLSWHKDDIIKYHIPVYTKAGCFFVTKHGAHTMLDEGRTYIVRTDFHHTAFNASDKDRIHLTIDTTPAREESFFQRCKSNLALKLQ